MDHHSASSTTEEPPRPSQARDQCADAELGPFWDFLGKLRDSRRTTEQAMR